MLSGHELLFQQFQPRHKLSIQDVCPVLGIKKDALWKRIREGKCDLRIRKDEYGQNYVTLADLARYLYPDEFESFSAPDAPPIPEKNYKPGPGRPRKSVGNMEGGAR
jgi:hypothetical protein